MPKRIPNPLRPRKKPRKGRKIPQVSASEGCGGSILISEAFPPKAVLTLK